MMTPEDIAAFCFKSGTDARVRRIHDSCVSDSRDYNAMRDLMSAHPRDVRGGDLFRTPAQLLRERMESDETAAVESANNY